MNDSMKILIPHETLHRKSVNMTVKTWKLSIFDILENRNVPPSLNRALNIDVLYAPLE